MRARLVQLWREPRRRLDLLLVLFLYAFSALLYAEAAKLPPPFFDPLGSAAVPKFAASVLALLATLLLARNLAEVRPQADVEPGPANAPLLALAALAVTVAYVALMHGRLLGFREATMLFVFALGALLARFERRATLALVPLAIFCGLFFHYIFTQVFYVDLPVVRLF